MPPRPLSDILRAPTPQMRRGPVALVFDEDGVALVETLSHLRRHGVAALLLFSAAPPDLPEELAACTHLVSTPARTSAATLDAVNRTIAALPGVWLHYCYNAEFLHYPFCETRSLPEMLAFHAEERRDAMLAYAVDLYAGDLGNAPDAVDLADCWLDGSGYFALNRQDEHGQNLDRQWDLFGGLRWRFEQHVSPERRRLDRVGLFRAKAGLRLLEGHRFSDPEYNTISCPWHNNLTAAICSFRVAKALRRNPGSRSEIQTFRWPGSRRFGWTGRELLDLGMMEPGQWF